MQFKICSKTQYLMPFSINADFENSCGEYWLSTLYENVPNIVPKQEEVLISVVRN